MRATQELRSKAVELRRIAMRAQTDIEKRVVLDLAFDCERAAKKLTRQESRSRTLGAHRERRRASFMRALSEHDLLELHAETLMAAIEGNTVEAAEVFPEAEFDTWEDWSLAIEAELDRRCLNPP